MKILCTIDLLTREVSLPGDQCIAAYDHNVDVIHFQAEPVDGFDFDTSSIRIAAQGPNMARHDYAVDPSTVSIEEETGYITFDWLIPAGVTEMPIGAGFKYGDKGQLIFAVCAEIISGDTVSKAWHSDDGIITVVAHLEPESGGGEDPEEEATNAQKIGQLQTDVAVINTQVGALANGSPTPVATVAEMTDESAVYLYTGSESGYTAGNWYYYNGTAWTSGGVYGGAVTDTTLSISGAAADAKAVGDALADKADSSDVTALDTRVTAVEDALEDKGDSADIDDLKNAFDLVENSVFDNVDVMSPVTFATNNTAVTDNGDGTYNVGTADYGNSFFNNARTFKSGTYVLYGVPFDNGFSFVTSANSHTDIIVKNDTGKPMRFTLESDTANCRVGLRINARPSTAFTVRPYLYRIDDKIASLDESANARYTMYPTGDTSNRAFEIASALSTYKWVYLAPGDYTISTKLTVPSGIRLTGAGKASHLIFDESATGQMIECGNDCQISNLWIDGGATSKPTDNSANRHGIRLQNNKQTLQIDSCYITGFGGSAIRIDSTGFAQLSSIQMTNCYFQYNGIGIHFLEHGEYAVVSNCSFIDNYFGALVQGGNNIINGSAFERNTYGGSVNGANVSNSGHGAFVGCSFNHNTHTGLQILSSPNGYLVSGCQMFRNETLDLSISATGVNVIGCNFGVSPKLNFSGDCIASFDGNMFGSQPTLSYTDNAKTKSANNWTFAGNKVNILYPGSIVDENAVSLERYNATNILPLITIPRTVKNDIAYYANNGVYTFQSGTASAFTTINIGDTWTAIPEGFSEGDRVYVFFRDTEIPGVYFQIVWYDTGTVIFQTATSGWFIMPAVTAQIRLRISIASGTTLSGETGMPYIGKAPTNGMLGQKTYLENTSPMLTIIDDDGHSRFYSDLLPLIQSKKVPISTAIYNTSVGVASNTMTWEQVKECYENGAEILSHTYDHADSSQIAERTESEIQYYDQMAKNGLLERGYTGGRFVVYAGATGDITKVRKAASNVYECGINSAGNVMNYIGMIDPYNIKRYRVESDYGYTSEALNGLIDECISSNGGWMIWMIHTSANAWGADAVYAIGNAIDYAISHGLQIVTVETGCRKMHII